MGHVGNILPLPRGTGLPPGVFSPGLFSPMGSAFNLLPLPLAAVAPDRLDAIRDAFNNVHSPGDPLETVRWVLAAVGLLLLMLVVAGLRRWNQQRHRRSRPVLVFRQIARDLGLPGRDQWLLVRIAHQQALPSPVTLLLSPLTLAHHARRFTHNYSRRRRQRVLRQVAQVRRKLFVAATP